MEPEYIERKALDKALTAAAAHDKDKNRRTWAKAICILHDLPAADVAAVVYCKDCAHRTEMGNCGHPRYHGILPSAYPYDFCSYGARMDDGACNQVCKYNTPDRGCVAGELGARCDLANVTGKRGNGEAG